MKTFKEILYHKFRESGGDLNSIQMIWVLLSMKEVHDQAVDLCLEKVKLLKDTNFEGSCILDKESILKVKNMLNNEK